MRASRPDRVARLVRPVPRPVCVYSVPVRRTGPVRMLRCGASQQCDD